MDKRTTAAGIARRPLTGYARRPLVGLYTDRLGCVRDTLYSDPPEGTFARWIESMSGDDLAEAGLVAIP